MSVYKYVGPIHKNKTRTSKTLEPGHYVKIVGKTEYENVYKVQNVRAKHKDKVLTHVVHSSHLEPVDRNTKISFGKTPPKKLKEHKMLSFTNFLLEALEPLPGKNRGWGEVKNIDGNTVRIQHRKNVFGKTYKPLVTINGKIHKTKNHSPETNSRIIGAVKDSTKEFLRDKQPPRVKIMAGGGDEAKKQRVYNAFAKSQIAKKAGYSAKEKKNSVVLKHAGASSYQPSGVVKRDTNNPVHKSFAADSDKKWKAKWFSNKDKSPKFDIKKHIKKAIVGGFAGGGGDFGGGGSSGSW